MDKVKVGKEVADAFEVFNRGKDKDWALDFSEIMNKSHRGIPCAKILWRFIQGSGRAKYASMVLNGFEVELTPEQKVKELYDECRAVRKLSSCGAYRKGIEDTLRSLGKEIGGITDCETEDD